MKNRNQEEKMLQMKDKRAIGIRIVHSKKVISSIKSIVVLAIDLIIGCMIPNNRAIRLYLSIMNAI